jgi:hypothetical protein
MLLRSQAQSLIHHMHGANENTRPSCDAQTRRAQRRREAENLETCSKRCSIFRVEHICHHRFKTAPAPQLKGYLPSRSGKFERSPSKLYRIATRHREGYTEKQRARQDIGAVVEASCGNESNRLSFRERQDAKAFPLEHDHLGLHNAQASH